MANRLAEGQTKGKRVLVVGECLVDLAPTSPAPLGTRGDERSPGAPRAGTSQCFKAMPGGSPANVAIGLARLEVPVAFAARLSRLGFGPWLRRNLELNHVSLEPSVEADEPPTLAVVNLDDHKRASYTFYGPGTADWQWHPHELVAPGGLQGVAAVHTGSLALSLPPGATVVAEWLRAVRQGTDVVVSVDPNVRPGFIGDVASYVRHLGAVLTGAHMVKLSTEDVAVVSGGRSPQEAARHWLASGTELVVVTDGPRGALALHRNGARAEVAAPAVEVVDTIGAGDTFSAGFLAWLYDHGLLHPAALAGMGQAELEAALAQAVLASALTCTRAGSDPPGRQELADFAARQG